MQKSDHSVAGPDEVHYNLQRTYLKQFSDFWKIYNTIVVIPIPRLGKDPKNPINHRTLVLTSCFCKTMEHMVNGQLMWCLESEGHLSDVKCGFGRSVPLLAI